MAPNLNDVHTPEGGAPDSLHRRCRGGKVTHGIPFKRPWKRRWVPVLALAACLTTAWATPEAVHHRLDVVLQPERGRLVVTDRIRWPDGARPQELELALNGGFQPRAEGAVRITPTQRDGHYRRVYRVSFSDEGDTLTLHYQGAPQTPPAGRGSVMPAAVVDGEGVYLDGASAWYPQLDAGPFTAELMVHHPPGWLSVSQGRREPSGDPTLTRWRSDQPQAAIYLLAGPYHFYAKPGAHGEAEAFLRTPDPALAQRYLALTDGYLDLYSRLIGPYPYPKFAVVENRWETGYGMPSFTLLGPRVMRLPFILTSSYPHEILHNWWGNSVYPDYATGNWSEGLTSYLADHLIQEQRGLGARYRRGALQKYADYVARERDFPLRDFRARHNETTQAVGYGKALMLFHMLRRRIGDANFRAGLQRIYRDYRYRVAGFDDLRREFEAVSGQSLAGFFSQWVDRTGAPSLAIDRAQVSKAERGGFQLRVRLKQTQSATPYDLRVPVAITLQGKPQVQMAEIALNGVDGERTLTLPARPLRLDVDPRFDLFRRLAIEELPPSLGQVYGARRLTLVLPTAAEPQVKQAYRELARLWRRRFPHLQVQDDTRPLPADGGVWVLGAANRHAAAVLKAAGSRYRVMGGGDVRIGSEVTAPEGLSVVLALRRSATSTLAYLQSASAAAVPALARKLPHYGKYSYLAFRGTGAVNVIKGEWPVDNSPLSRPLAPGNHPRGEVPAETALIR